MEDYIRANLPESRLQLLYSDFAEKKLLNPDGYEANILTWRQFIVKYVGDGHNNDLRLSFNSSLPKQLALTPYGAPKSLNLVIDDGVSDMIWEPWLQYQNRGTRSLLGKVWLALWAGHYNSKKHHDRFVVADVVERLAPSCWQAALSAPDGELLPELTTAECLRRRIADAVPVKAIDIDILTTRWQERHQCRREGDYIKLNSLEITDSEKTFIDVKNACQATTKRNEGLAAELSRLEKKTRDLVKTKAPEARIKHLLRLKKRVLQLLDQGMSSESQLGLVMMKLDESQLNVVVMDAMQDAAEAMKYYNDRLNTDDVDAVKDSIVEEMSKIDEVGARLAEVNIDEAAEAEVDDEFDRMLREETMIRVAKEKVAKEKVAEEKAAKEKATKEKAVKESATQAMMAKENATTEYSLDERAKKEEAERSTKEPVTNDLHRGGMTEDTGSSETQISEADLEKRLEKLRISSKATENRPAVEEPVAENL